MNVVPCALRGHFACTPISSWGSSALRALGYLIVLVCALLISAPVSAEACKGWLGADVQDITKTEADKFGWDSPHGAKQGVVASGSPAERAGLKMAT
jgi:S1-C subfamily serine protease